MVHACVYLVLPLLLEWIFLGVIVLFNLALIFPDKHNVMVISLVWLNYIIRWYRNKMGWSLKKIQGLVMPGAIYGAIAIKLDFVYLSGPRNPPPMNGGIYGKA